MLFHSFQSKYSLLSDEHSQFMADSLSQSATPRASSVLEKDVIALIDARIKNRYKKQLCMNSMKSCSPSRSCKRELRFHIETQEKDVTTVRTTGTNPIPERLASSRMTILSILTERKNKERSPSLKENCTSKISTKTCKKGSLQDGRSSHSGQRLRLLPSVTFSN
mmetsp:Transcript_3525/g.5260  ORF Transcript_3525/g.5260 Transcript_3525/m.5260 type:complete len:165 (+) Transcript_3525:497-991(+)